MSELPFAQSEIAIKLANYKLPRYDELTPFPVVMRQLVRLLVQLVIRLVRTSRKLPFSS